MLRPDIKQTLTEELNQQTLDRMQNNLFSVMEDLQGQLRYEPEMAGWTAAGSTERDLPIQDQETLEKESLKNYYKNPHGRVVIRNLVKFIIGGGSIIDFHEKSEEGLTAITSWWRKHVKKTKWFRFQREFLTRAFRDGNLFVRKFSVDGEPLTLRFVERSNIGGGPRGDGIITDPRDVETVTGFWVKERQNTGTAQNPRWEDVWVEVPATEMLHKKYDVDANVKLGHPVLESVLTDLGEYRQWRKARMVLNIVRTSVALVKEVQGSPNDLSRLRVNQKTVRQTNNETDKQKMLRPGTIIQGTPGTKYSMLSANLDAKDASEDGANILRAVAAGAGFPDVFVTANYADSNYAATVVSQNTGIREVEDNGNVFIEDISDVIDWILIDGVEQGEIPKMVTDEKTGERRPINLDYTINLPPIIKRDIVQENTAYQVMNEHHILSPQSWAAKMGFDSDREQGLWKEWETTNPASALPSSNGDTGRVAPKRVEDRQPRAQIQA